MSQKNNIVVNRTASYYTLGNIATAKTVWFVLHGYGHLANYFIKKFEPILNNTTVIVAPEGLSKFYLNGVGYDGRVGASWMTKESREDEIVDYINYLNQLYTAIVKQNNTPNIKVNVLGFSQGGATASRWVSNKQIKCTNFILWSSMFPDDMNFEAITDTNTYFLYGKNDEYLTEEKSKRQLAIIDNPELKVNVSVFEGTHTIPEKVLVEETKKNKWG